MKAALNLIFKNNLLKLLFISLVSISSAFAVRFNYPHMMGVYISPEGMDKISHNLEGILDQNGISISNFYHHHYQNRPGKKKLEELISDQGTLKSIKKVRYLFRRFFTGFYIKNYHDIDVNVNGIDLSAHWKEFSIDAMDASYENEQKISLKFKAVADRIKFSTEKASVIDHQHNFIGEIAVNHFDVSLESESEPFEFTIKTTLGINKSGGMEIEIDDITTNLMDINLEADWRAPLVLPKVKIVVNGTPAYLNRKRLERDIKKEVPNLLSALQEKADQFLKEESKELLEEKLNSKLGKGFIEAIEISPLGAPEGEEGDFFHNIRHPNYIMGLAVSELNFQESHLHIGVDSFVKEHNEIIDLSKEKIIFHHEDRARFRPNVKELSKAPHDLAISMHKGFINGLLRKSSDRGYFSNMEVGDDNTKINLVRAPFIYPKYSKSAGRHQMRLKIKTEYTVTGASAIFVRNPIQLSFDIVLDLITEDDNKMHLVIDSIDENSLLLEEKYIRAFSGTVRSSARDILREYSKELRNYPLSENLPIPESIFGIPLRYNFYNVDAKGNIILYIDTDI